MPHPAHPPSRSLAPVSAAFLPWTAVTIPADSPPVTRRRPDPATPVALIPYPADATTDGSRAVSRRHRHRQLNPAELRTLNQVLVGPSLIST